jgi:hypothetical protein
VSASEDRYPGWVLEHLGRATRRVRATTFVVARGRCTDLHFVFGGRVKWEPEDSGRRKPTTSVRLAAASIAEIQALTILATTWQADREKLLCSSGVDYVVIEDGSAVEKIKTLYTDRVDKALELVGSTLRDSACCRKKGGTIC